MKAILKRKEIGKQLRELRLKINYSLEAVASDLNISTSALSRWECGSRSISLDMLIELAEYYNVSLTDLFICLN